MLEITKQNDKLIWVGSERTLTKNILEFGWEKVDDNSVHVELDSQVVYLPLNDFTIDGISFYSINELVSYIYGDN